MSCSLPGTFNPNARFSREEVAAIRSTWRNGEETCAALADRYGVDQKTIYKMVRGESYRDPEYLQPPNTERSTKKGERHPGHRLTESEVGEIKRLISDGGTPPSASGSAYRDLTLAVSSSEDSGDMSPEQAAIRRATWLAWAAVKSLDAAGRRELARAYREAAEDVRRIIAGHAGADDSVALTELRSVLAQIEARLAALERLRNGLLDEGLAKAADYGARVFEGGVRSSAAQVVSEGALRAVQAFVAADGLQLSDRLWRIDRGAREAVARAVERAVIEGQSALAAARDFLARGEAVPAEIVRKQGAANAARIGREAAGALTGQGHALDNAMRVFRTEINRAHGTAYMMGGEEKPFFGGWRFLLSPAHPEPDICDLLAAQNLHGLGVGVYPSGEKCPWPAHPNTLSFVEMVFKDEITAADRAGKETSMEALARLDPATRRGVLGANKAEAFEDGRLTTGMIRAPWRSVRQRVGG